jgi:hypothetical protein
MLLEFGADVNRRSADRITALLIASAKGHNEIVTILTASGATDSSQWMGLGPGELATGMHNTSVLRALEEATTAVADVTHGGRGLEMAGCVASDSSGEMVSGGSLERGFSSDSSELVRFSTADTDMADSTSAEQEGVSRGRSESERRSDIGGRSGSDSDSERSDSGGRSESESERRSDSGGRSDSMSVHLNGGGTEIFSAGSDGPTTRSSTASSVSSL